MIDSPSSLAYDAGMAVSEIILKFFTGSRGGDYSPEEKRTFFLDTARSGVDGIELTLVNSVFLLIAIQYFQVSDTWKSLISASVFMGMIVSLFTSSLTGNRKPNILAGLSTFVGGFFLMAAGLVQGAILFCLLLMVHNIFLLVRPPFFTAIYEANYPLSRRGKLYSAGIMFSIVTGLLSNYFFGKVLDVELGYFRAIFIATGAFLLVSGYLLMKIPYDNPQRKVRKNPLKNLALLYKNPLFGIVSLSWFIMGFANLWSIPLRVVYLAEGERGLGLSPFVTLIIIGFIPNAVKLLFSNIWARIFDRINMLLLRIVSTLLMGVGILLFFMTESIPVIIAGQVIMNIGFAGSPFLWNLWVTKIAPPGESQPYMSVHTFLCGIRGVLGPFAGFLFISSFSMRSVGLISFAMVTVSILILLPFVRQWSERKY